MTPPGDVCSMLRNVQCFSALDDQTLGLLRDRMHAQHYPAGHTLCREGEPGDRLFIIEQGETAVLKAGEQGQQIEVAVLSSGQIAGEMGLFGQRRRSATLRTRTDTTTWQLEYDVFETLLQEHGAFARALLHYFNQHLQRETSIVARLMARDMDFGLKVAVFDSKPYIQAALERHNTHGFSLRFFEERLTADTVSLAAGFKVVCVFVNDDLNATVIEALADLGVELIALRCAGYNNVDLAAAERLGLAVVRVPAYSPYAVAEHAVALMLSLNRQVHRANNRVREGNFSLRGLVGFDLHGKTVGVVGAGKIGQCVMHILHGFGCKLLVYNRSYRETLARQFDAEFVDFETLCRNSRIISLHVPLAPETYHLIDNKAIDQMTDGVMLINTSRGALIDTHALIDGLKSGKVGYAGLDVYEEESEYFFEDCSDRVMTDDTLARLTTFNNVMITSHQGFLTREALDNIAETTLASMHEYEQAGAGAVFTHPVRC